MTSRHIPLLFSLWVALGLLIALPAFAQSLAGTYSTDKSWRYDGNTYRLRYVLNLRSDSRVELTTSYIGSVPPANSETIREHGRILSYLRRENNVVHTGRWVQRDNTVTMTFSTLDGNRVSGTYVAGLTSNNRLNMYRYDSELYGRTAFEFVPTAQPSTGDIPRSTWVGYWQNSFDIPDDPGRLRRTLRLTNNGAATLTSEYLAGRRGNPDFSREAINDLGSLLTLFTSQRRVFSQTGTWSARGTVLTVRLTRLNDTRRTVNLRFQLLRNQPRAAYVIDATSYPVNLYGRDGFRLTKR